MKVVFTLFVVLMSFTAMAADSAWASENNRLFTEDQKTMGQKLKNIHQGNIEFEGDFNTFKNTRYDSSGIQLNLGARYFLFDKFSAGITGGFSKSGNYQSTRVGPSLRYYFLDIGKFAMSINQKVTVSRIKDGAIFYVDSVEVSRQTIERTSGATGLGFHYFISRYVAAGLNVNYVYDLERNFSPWEQGSTIASFFAVTFAI